MNKGNSSDDCLPKFFKVYLPDDSGDDLEIPISFNTCLPNSMPKNVTVRSIYGKKWKLKLRKCCGDIVKFVMVDGWKRIVKDEDLKGGELLAFEFDGSTLFNFCIYGHATCKRLGSSVKTKEMEDDKSGVDIIVIDDDDDDEEDDVAGDDDDDADADDDDDGDDQDSGDEDSVVDDERRSGVETETKEKGSSKVLTKSDSEDDRQYLDPFFTAKNRSAKAIMDYGLHIPEFITHSRTN